MVWTAGPSPTQPLPLRARLTWLGAEMPGSKCRTLSTPSFILPRAGSDISPLDSPGQCHVMLIRTSFPLLDPELGRSSEDSRGCPSGDQARKEPLKALGILRGQAVEAGSKAVGHPAAAALTPS